MVDLKADLKASVRIRLPIRLLVALVLSLALHASLFVADWQKHFPPLEVPVPIVTVVTPVKPIPIPPAKANKQVSRGKPAFMAAPSAPSAEEWALASQYAPRNGKRYRHAWGQQVRSMMGTAVAGPDQGQVRFRIEIGPGGKITKIEQLWATSEVAARLAWKAIRALPPLPPTPNGKPLIFEQTISFLPHETGWPPDYKLDCLPEPESFKNPFAWNGVSPPPNVEAREHRPPPAEDCIPDATAATIEEEERSAKRQMDQWRWGR